MPPFVAVSAVVVVEVAVGGSGGDVRSCVRTISEAYELSCKPDPDICLRACWPRYILWTSGSNRTADLLSDASVDY